MGAAWGWKVAGLFIFKTSFLRLFQRYSRGPNYFLIWGFSNIVVISVMRHPHTQGVVHTQGISDTGHPQTRGFSNLRLLRSEASQIWDPRTTPYPRHLRYRAPSNLRPLKSEASQIWGFSDLRLLRSEASQTWGFSNLRLLKPEASQIWGFSDLRLLRSEASQVKAIPVSSKAEAPPMWGIPVIPVMRHNQTTVRLLKSEASQIWGFSGQVIAPL